jgi:hypothetical protein
MIVTVLEKQCLKWRYFIVGTLKLTSHPLYDKPSPGVHKKPPARRAAFPLSCPRGSRGTGPSHSLPQPDLESTRHSKGRPLRWTSHTSRRLERVQSYLVEVTTATVNSDNDHPNQFTHGRRLVPSNTITSTGRTLENGQRSTAPR